MSRRPGPRSAAASRGGRACLDGSRRRDQRDASQPGKALRDPHHEQGWSRDARGRRRRPGRDAGSRQWPARTPRASPRARRHADRRALAARRIPAQGDLAIGTSNCPGGSRPSMIRVLIAEDQAMVRGALKALLAMEGDIEIVAETDRADEVLALALQTKPDVALLDIEMPGGDGITAACQLRQELPSCRTLILTTFGRPGFLRRAVGNGASGFMLKDAPSHELALALRRAIDGERVVHPGFAAAALSSGISPLSERERQVLV